MKFRNFLLVALSLATLITNPARAVENIDDITWATEDAAPFNYVSNGELMGPSVNIVKNILRNSGSKKTAADIKVLPWTEAYNNLQENKNYALFSTSRTKERERLFKWVGPLNLSAITLLAKKDANIKVKTINDIRQYNVGAVTHDVGQQLVKSKISDLKLDLFATLEQGLQALNSGAINLLAGDEETLRYLIRKNNLDNNNFVSTYTLDEVQLWIAFNKFTSDELIQKVQEAMNKQ